MKYEHFQRPDICSFCTGFVLETWNFCDIWRVEFEVHFSCLFIACPRAPSPPGGGGVREGVVWK